MKIPIGQRDFIKFYFDNPEYSKRISESKFIEFLIKVYTKLEELNQSGKPLNPAVFECYPLVCVCELDNEGKLVFDSEKLFCGVDSFFDKKTNEIKKGTLSRQSINDYIEYYMAKGYSVISIDRSEMSDMKRCKWCGKVIDSSSDYCPSVRLKNGKYYSECREKDKNFKKTYNNIMQTWDEYKRLLSSDKDAAEELKNKSAYKHLLESGCLLVKVKIEYDSGLYTGLELQRRLRLPCLNCGGQIPDDKALQSRFCCSKCKSEYHNKKNK